MNSYEQRQEQKRQRYLDRAKAAERASDAAFNSTANKTLANMQGEPIKIGHHSERRHRRLIERADRDMRRSIDESNKAKHYEQKAATVGRGGISSDDPEALAKLRAKLEGLEKMQADMKAANKIIRSKPKNESTPEKIEQLTAMGFESGRAHQLFKPDFCGRIGFPSYALQNNNANIKRVRLRVATLEHAEQAKQEAGDDTERVTHEGDGFQVVEHIDDGRIWFVFDSKPSRETCQMMRRNGWKWSRQRMAWVRHLNGNGRASAQCVAKQLAD